VDFPLAQEIINERQHWATNFMIRLRTCALMRLDVAKIGEVLKDLHGLTMPDGVVLDGDYIYILDHRLSKSDSITIEAVCWNSATQAWMHQNTPDIQIAFRNLLAVLEDMYAAAISTKHKESY
jgi:hypothetical protein